MNIISTIKNIIFSKYLISLGGIVFISYYIWFRFIRARLPREIPFDLNLLSLIFILCTCVIYSYILFRIFFPKEPGQITKQILLFLNKMYIPLITAHDLVINISFIQKIYETIIKTLRKIIKYSEPADNHKQYTLYLFVFILPRILFLFVFIIDIFIFHKFFYIYKFIFLGLIPLFIKFLIFCLRNSGEKYTIFLEENFKVQILNDFVDDDNNYYFVSIRNLERDDYDDLIRIRYFIYIQSFAICYQHTLYDYTCVETWNARVNYAALHKIELVPLYRPIPNTDEISRILAKDFHSLMPMVIDISSFLMSYDHIQTYDQIKKINIFIIILYLICWLYILSISFKISNLIEILNILNLLWKHVFEPFSDSTLDDSATS